ncbi:MAG: hypothetical protein EXS13_07540 [Planctomycetes bacterium]|nr:hypothetical protein [Planctomycetota bacterium]
MSWFEGVLAVVMAGGFAWIAMRQNRLHSEFGRLDRLPTLADLKTISDAAMSDERLRPLADALRRMADQLASLPVPAEAKDLLPIQERLEMLARQLHELRLHVDELRARTPGGAGSEPVAPGARLLRSLEARGFEHVHILGELVGDDGTELHRVPVEARRSGMSFKGHVTIEDGRLIEVALKPLTEIFP